MFREYNEERKDAPFIDVADWPRFRSSGPVVLVDVREPEERAVSMIPEAIAREEFEHNAESYRKKKVVCYCTVGGRSGVYTEQLRGRGFDAFNLKGSVLSWAHAGGKFVDANGNETHRVHVAGPTWDLLPDGYESVY